MTKKEELLKSENFCMMPWIHMHIWPNGAVYPCCLANSDKEFGNTHQSTIGEIINSQEFKSLRNNMLENKPSAACTRCYELERTAGVHTLRKQSLLAFSQHLDEALASTEADGSVSKFKMAYMDIRFSNLCNFKCRTCGPIFSSAWQEEENKSAGKNEKTIPLSLLSKESFWSDIEPHLNEVEEVYFAGGESLISPEHYKILDHWIQHGKTDVRLRYTTNFSHFRFKSKDLLEYWAQFKDVRVAASLDAEGARGEYLRKGTNWETIVRNRQEMIERCPHVYFEITPTVSVYNCFDLPDFHRSWIEKGLLSPQNVRVNYLLHPSSMRAQILPIDLKVKLKKKYDEHNSYLAGLEEAMQINLSETKKAFAGIIDFVFEQDLTDELPEFYKTNDYVDKVRTEKLTAVFPELRDLKA